jgi:ActR/RegA family two-component response regulator
MEHDKGTTPGAARSVLVIEDQSIVACDLERFLGGAGYRVVGPVCSVAAALGKIADSDIQGAIVDVKLDSDAIGQVAEALKAARIPHIFVNGWAVGTIPERCRERPLLNNPYDYHSLLDALNGAMGDKGHGLST